MLVAGINSRIGSVIDDAPARQLSRARGDQSAVSAPIVVGGGEYRPDAGVRSGAQDQLPAGRSVRVSGCCSRTAAPVVLLGLATYAVSPPAGLYASGKPSTPQVQRELIGRQLRVLCGDLLLTARSCRSSRRRRRAGWCDRPRAGRRCVRRFARRQPPRASSEPGSGASSASTGTSVPTALNSSRGRSTRRGSCRASSRHGRARAWRTSRPRCRRGPRCRAARRSSRRGDLAGQRLHQRMDERAGDGGRLVAVTSAAALEHPPQRTTRQRLDVRRGAAAGARRRAPTTGRRYLLRRVRTIPAGARRDVEVGQPR